MEWLGELHGSCGCLTCSFGGCASQGSQLARYSFMFAFLGENQLCLHSSALSSHVRTYLCLCMLACWVCVCIHVVYVVSSTMRF